MGHNSLWQKSLVTFLITVFASSAFAATVVATVGSKKITLKEFRERYNDVLEQTVNPPTKKQFLEDLIRYEVGLQEAEKKNLRKDKIVRERIRQEIYKGLIEKELGKKIEKIKVTQSEMKRYYAKNPEIRTSHILIQFKPNANAKEKAIAKKRAQEILKDVLKSKRPFADLAKIYSDDTLSKENGGDVGWQSRMTIMPNYYNTAYRLRNNQIARRLVETRFGYHIIKRTGKRTYANANKAQIRTGVYDEKRKQIFNRYFISLKRKYKISVNKKALK